MRSKTSYFLLVLLGTTNHQFFTNQIPTNECFETKSYSSFCSRKICVFTKSNVAIHFDWIQVDPPATVAMDQGNRVDITQLVRSRTLFQSTFFFDRNSQNLLKKIQTCLMLMISSFLTLRRRLCLQKNQFVNPNYVQLATLVPLVLEKEKRFMSVGIDLELCHQCDKEYEKFHSSEVSDTDIFLFFIDFFIRNIIQIHSVNLFHKI